MFRPYPILILLILVSMQRSYDDDGQPIHFDVQLHQAVDSLDSLEIQALVPF